jgi:hypothetical protein
MARPVVVERQRQPRARHAVPDGVQPAEGLDRLLEHPLTPLPVGLLRRIASQRGDHLDVIAGQEAGSSSKRGATRIVRLHRSMTSRPRAWACSTIHRKWWLISGAPPVMSRVGMPARTSVQAVLYRLRRHHLAAVRPGVDVAVPAGLVAHIADVDLEHSRSRSPREAAVRSMPGRRRTADARRVRAPPSFRPGWPAGSPDAGDSTRRRFPPRQQDRPAARPFIPAVADQQFVPRSRAGARRRA